MSNTDLTPNINDEDVILFWRPLTSGAQRKTMRTTWGMLKQRLLASVAVVEGPRGPQGEAGERGQQGLKGATGAQGDQGIPGATGPQGATGAQGLPGTTGAPGAKGDTGPVGSVGATGPAGSAAPVPKSFRYTAAVVGSAGAATLTIPSTDLATILDVDAILTWTGTGTTQMVAPFVSSGTARNVVLKGMISQGTLVLGASPFGIAPAGTILTMRAIGY